MPKACKKCLFIFFLLAFSLFAHMDARADMLEALRIQSNNPVEILMACVQKITDLIPSQGIAGTFSQLKSFLEYQIELRKSIFWIEFEKERLELYTDAMRVIDGIKTIF